MLILACSIPAESRVKPGIDVLLQDISPLRGCRVGLVTNPTGITSDFTSSVDALHSHAEIRLVALFGPEHGVRGDETAGKKIDFTVDGKTGLPVYSLYGATKKPTPEMLKNIDVLVFDMQDIGSRAYTYLYTMAYVLEAAKENDLPVYVLDRPNPLGGNLLDGPVLEPAFKSFIGRFPIPYVYGMTIGELAVLFNTEFGIGAQLTVIPMSGWQRNMTFEDTGLTWVPTSPHIPHAATAFLCACTGGIGELQVLNEGVGYTLPFELIGAPWIDAETLADELNVHKISGVFFRPVHYKPYYFGYQNQSLAGVHIHILNTGLVKPVEVQISLLCALKKLYPEHVLFSTERTSMFDKAMGTDRIRLMVEKGASAEEIIASWQKELAAFDIVRKQYLLY
ncbi:DUF1343 domain-containing protein [candidate division KSB1 bacterium]|nr:DUF1343 domain-containing protein [candidate division KSB1 bacterium]